MREKIIEILIEALNSQGYPDLTLETVRNRPEHQQAFLLMLDDCRPLPVILKLKADARAGRL